MRPSQLYSPNLGPCDFFLFPNVKTTMQGKRPDSIHDADGAKTRAFQNRIGKWREWWDGCVWSKRSVYRGVYGVTSFTVTNILHVIFTIFLITSHDWLACRRLGCKTDDSPRQAWTPWRACVPWGFRCLHWSCWEILWWFRSWGIAVGLEVTEPKLERIKGIPGKCFQSCVRGLTKESGLSFLPLTPPCDAAACFTALFFCHRTFITPVLCLQNWHSELNKCLLYKVILLQAFVRVTEKQINTENWYQE